MGKRSGGARADGRRAAARSSDRLPELGQPVGRERDRKAKRPQKNRGAPAPLVPAAAWSQWQTGSVAQIPSPEWRRQARSDSACATVPQTPDHRSTAPHT